MYILTFKRSRSKYFEKGLTLAESLGGAWDGQQMTIKIPDAFLLKAYEPLIPLFQIIQNWSSTAATYNGRKVHPFRFILSMHFLDECAMKSNEDPENCLLYDDCPGWSCKKLDNIFFLELGNGKYTKNDRYWYNFGSFNSENEWVIDKDAILEKLIQFAEETGLTNCPYFDKEKVEESVANLPSKIIPDNVNYRIHYTILYSKGEELDFPENIRHISQKYQDHGEPSRLKYDLSKIKIIRRFENGEISDDAMAELLRKPIKKN